MVAPRCSAPCLNMRLPKPRLFVLSDCSQATLDAAYCYGSYRLPRLYLLQTDCQDSLPSLFLWLWPLISLSANSPPVLGQTGRRFSLAHCHYQTSDNVDSTTPLSKTFVLMAISIILRHSRWLPDNTCRHYFSYLCTTHNFHYKDDCIFIGYLLNQIKFQVRRIRITRLSMSLLLMLTSRSALPNCRRPQSLSARLAYQPIAHTLRLLQSSTIGN